MTDSNEEVLIQNAKLFIALREKAPKEEKQENIINCLKKGANINERFSNDRNNTPLHISVIKEDKDTVIFLLDLGANSDYKNNDDKSPLDIAKELQTDTGRHIVNILESHNNKSPNEKTTNTTKNIISKRISLETKDSVFAKFMFKKRPGTTGIKGELYETKLLSLIYIRATLNKELDQFYLGSSLEGIGALDDICLRYERNERKNIIFLQAKHKENVTKHKITINDLWNATGDFSLLKYFNSYLKIRQRFNIKNDDEMFRGHYEDVKCYFFLYTTIKDDFDCKKYVDVYKMDKTVNELVCSGETSDVFQYQYNENDIEKLSKIILLERIKNLGKRLFKHIREGKSISMLNDELIRKFHVVLAQRVINVSDINEEGFRMGSIRPEFFCSNDELLISLKSSLFSEALNDRQCHENVNHFISSVLINPTPESISKVIGNVIVYNEKNNKLEIKDIKIKDQIKGAHYLSKIEVTRTTINEAIEIAGIEILSSGQWSSFTLSSTFGNIDMAILDSKADKRIKYLAGKVINLLSKSENKTITINQDLINSNNSLEPGVLNVKGGLGSAVGNLLILDENKYLKFNMLDKHLGKHATKLLQILKDNVTELDSFRFKINIEGFPNLLFDTDECDTKIVKDFLDSLWFYTSQARENEIEKHIKIDIEEYNNKNKETYQTISTNHAEAIFLKTHNEIQKWWMLEYKTYLTKKLTDFNIMLNEFADKSFLVIINYIFLNKMKEYGLQFNEDSVKYLCLDKTESGLTVIVTENNILTSIKLVQYYQDVDSVLYFDLDYVLLLSSSDYGMVTNELNKLKIKVLVILCKIISKTNINQFLRHINTYIASKVIAVTSERSILEIRKSLTDTIFIEVKDVKCNLTDLTLESRIKALKVPLIYQGIEVEFNDVVNEESMHLINSHILNKIINKEKLSIGKTLIHSNYIDIKDYYIERRLCHGKSSTSMQTYFTDEETRYFSSSSAEDGSCSSHSSCEFMPFSFNINKKKIFKAKSLEALKDTVIILAAPGMGKSTLLTHLSITTKTMKPFVWIERINLLDYTKEFHRWQENKIKIRKLEAFKFICNAALSKNTSRFNLQHQEEHDYDLKIKNGQLKLKNCNVKNVLDLFELEMFIHCYNKGDMYLLFDGFDEICPHYEVEITQLLKALSTRLPCKTDKNTVGEKEKLWITSRSYNNIRRSLEREFGSSYTLEPFSDNDQNMYLEKYFQKNFNIKEFTYDQFLNVDSLFGYMKQFNNLYYYKSDAQRTKLTSVLLHSIYFAAVVYFQSEIKQIHLAAEKQIFRDKWNLGRFIVLDKILANWYDISEAMNLSRTPLHMHIALDYFQNEIKGTNYSGDRDSSNKWDLDTNTFAFYERFLETKLKKIRFEEKGQVDIYNPDMKMIYDKEHREFVNKHKKLAFYALFKDDLGELLTEIEIVEIKDTIIRMEKAEEKTGLVEYVINGVPKFVHLTFAEYFAVEYLTDLLKTTEGELEQAKLWKFILCNVMFRSSRGLMNLFDNKLKMDSGLMNIISGDDLKNFIFKELSRQTVDPYPPEAYDDYIGDPSEFTETALDKAVMYGLRYVAMILLKAVTDIVNESNLNKFLYLVKECKYFNAAVSLGFDEILEQAIDCIRNVDSKKLSSLFTMRIFTRVRTFDCSNEEIINDLKSQLNDTRNTQYFDY